MFFTLSWFWIYDYVFANYIHSLSTIIRLKKKSIQISLLLNLIHRRTVILFTEDN